jgi:hypothetical protein
VPTAEPLASRPAQAAPAPSRRGEAAAEPIDAPRFDAQLFDASDPMRFTESCARLLSGMYPDFEVEVMAPLTLMLQLDKANMGLTLIDPWRECAGQLPSCESVARAFFGERMPGIEQAAIEHNERRRLRAEEEAGEVDGDRPTPAPTNPSP